MEQQPALHHTKLNPTENSVNTRSTMENIENIIYFSWLKKYI